MGGCDRGLAGPCPCQMKYDIFCTVHRGPEGGCDESGLASEEVLVVVKAKPPSKRCGRCATSAPFDPAGPRKDGNVLCILRFALKRKRKETEEVRLDNEQPPAKKRRNGCGDICAGIGSFRRHRPCDEEEEDACCVCLVNARRVTLIPCGHTPTCFSCYNRLIKAGLLCPLCRTPVAFRMERPSTAR